MKKAPSKLLALLLAVVMVFSVVAPGAVYAAPAGDSRVTEVSLPDQDWQMNRAFPNGTDDTLAINSLGSFNGYRDQGMIYVTLDAQVESLRLFVNNVEIETAGMVGGKTYKAEGHIFNPEKSYGYGGSETLEALVEKLMGRDSFRGQNPTDPFLGKEHLKR